MFIKSIVFLLIGSTAIAGTEYVQGYMRADGSYVQGYYRTTADSTPLNNYSTRGNTNPFTGREGTVSPYSPPKQKFYNYNTY